MGDSAYTARQANAKIALERIGKISLIKDEAGQYQHDAAVKYIANVTRELGTFFNLLDSKNGMVKLIEESSNTINSIKSTSAYSADDVLKMSKQKAAKISKDTGTTATPSITTRSDAQEEADRLNNYSQAVIGVKEGTVEAFIAAVGHDVLDTVLIDADGTSPKGIDDYLLSDLTKLIISGANRPKANDVLKQLVTALTMPFDHRKKVATNVEILKSKAARVQAYGITIDTPMIVLIIFANIELAQQHEWGREFRPAMQSIRAAFPYSHKHDDASLATILQHLAAADSVRVLREAPEPDNEAANAVSNELSLLQQMMQEAQDYEEQAFAAAESDSDTSAERNRRKKSSRRRDNDRHRNRSRSSNRRYRSQSRRRDIEDKPKNKCPHCKKYRPRVWGTHEADKCFYNKAYKGYRPLQVCGEIGMVFKKRDKFPKELGGYSDSEGESGSE
jgi:hypothetical protein